MSETRIDEIDEVDGHSRRSFLTRGAVGAAAAVVGGAALVAVEATPAFAAVGATTFITPVRVFDSRVGQPQAGTGAKGIFTKGDAARQVQLGVSSIIFGSNIIPANALGALLNVTITGSVSSGAIAVTSAATGSTTTSSINWFAAGQTLANGLTVPVSFISGGKFANDVCAINIHVVGGTNGVSKAECIIDCSGYIAGS